MINKKLDVDKIDNMINYCLYKNQPKLKQELINEIHPDINIPYNSLNIAVGRQRSGKTQTIIREIIKISNISSRTHLLIYINKTGTSSDPTFESLKPLIKIPILYVSEENAESTVQDILKWKKFYNQIKENKWENEIIEGQISQLFEKLYINNFNNLTLHTLIFF